MRYEFVVKRLLSIGAVCASVVVCGCVTTATNVSLSVEAQAGEALNPSIKGRPSPVVVRIYQLKSNTKFNSADFLSLYEKDRETLGDEFLSREERIMEPGKAFSYDAAVLPETRFFAVFAGFRDVSKAQWRDQIEFDDAFRHTWFGRSTSIPVGVLANGQRIKVEVFSSPDERAKWVSAKTDEGGQLLREKAADMENSAKDRATEASRRKAEDAVGKAAGKARLPF